MSERERERERVQKSERAQRATRELTRWITGMGIFNLNPESHNNG